MSGAPRIRPIIEQPDDPSYRLIPLTQGQVALVDAEDFEELNQFRWYAQWSPETRSFYAARATYNGKLKTLVHMHRHVMKAPIGFEVDHHHHNTLDNRKRNLRLATHPQNVSNQRLKRNNTSGYRGVSWRNDTQKWHVHIMLRGKKTALGAYANPEDGALVYNCASLWVYGKFAYINEIANSAFLISRKRMEELSAFAGI